jgi:ketosteroid isomerase-like protein
MSAAKCGIRRRDPGFAEFIIGRAFARPVGSSGLRLQEGIEMSQTKSDIIRALFAAYRSNDRNAVEDFFTDDFRFTSPYDDTIDKVTYFATCWRNSDWIERQQLERIFVDGDEAFVTYQVVTKDGKRFRNTEFFRFDGERIQRIEVYFGATYQDGVFAKQA